MEIKVQCREEPPFDYEYDDEHDDKWDEWYEPIILEISS